MAHRPAILQSRHLRELCPTPYRPQRRRIHASSEPTPEPCSNPLAVNVTDDQVARLAAKPLYPLALSDLVRHGRPPLSIDSLLSSANFTLSIIPIRLAHRIQALRNLPFIVVSNPHISRIYNNYLHSLETLLPFQSRPCTTLDDEKQFTEIMADLVQTHANTIPTLARGFLECKRYISPDATTRFLDEHLRARIGTRLIAEQHIALHLSSIPHSPPPTSNPTTPLASDTSTTIGVIDTALRPAPLIRHCETFVSELCELKYGVRPSLSISSDPATIIAHVPMHLEYIVTELLKNAFRATVETGHERHPVEVTIAASTPGSYPHPESVGNVVGDGNATIPTAEPLDASPGVTIRIRDRGGGIHPAHLPRIWGYSFSTFGDDAPLSPSSSTSSSNAYTSYGSNNTIDALNTLSASNTGVGEGAGASSIAGLGYGLPLGRAYAEYFGGGITVQSLWGWGTDVYLRLRGLGRM